MPDCNDCKRAADGSELVIDHLLPRSHPDFNAMANIRMVHRYCNRRQPWYKRLWRRIKAIFGK